MDTTRVRVVAQSAASLRAVTAPKLLAAQRLGAACAAEPVGCWALFSSLSALLGTPGQANYAAANAQLNALADAQGQAGEHTYKLALLRTFTSVARTGGHMKYLSGAMWFTRVSWASQHSAKHSLLLGGTGIRSTSIMWGPWAIGMAASEERLNARFARAGLIALQPALGLRLLRAALGLGLSQAVAAPIAWGQLLKTRPYTPAIFQDLVEERPQPGPTAVRPATSLAAQVSPCRTCTLLI